MTNQQVVNNLNSLNKFIGKENGKALLNVKAEFKVFKNMQALNTVYQAYYASLEQLRARYQDETSQEYLMVVKELLNIDTDIDIQTITENDFLDGCSLEDIMLLEFMLAV